MKLDRNHKRDPLLIEPEIEPEYNSIRCEGCCILVGPGHMEVALTLVECSVATVHFPDILCRGCRQTFQALMDNEDRNERAAGNIVVCEACEKKLAGYEPEKRIRPALLNLCSHCLESARSRPIIISAGHQV